MEKRKIKNVESTSIGKTTGHNDDGIYIGENFAAVIDGVSSKSTVEVNGKKVNIANIIIEALEKLDRPSAPVYAKTLSFEEFVEYINMYIRKYCQTINISLTDTPLEATAAIYSKYYNQIWIIGDCRAIYDGNVISNDLKIDEVYTDLRVKIINELLNSGYRAEKLWKEDISKKIIANPQDISQYISDEELVAKIGSQISSTMKQSLLECGFTEKEIEEQGLLEKYRNPRDLQQYLKNNPNVGEYGYSVLNGIKTATENCICQDLPENVRDIKLFSDGFPIEALRNRKDLGYAIRKIRSLASNDPLSINRNKAVKAAIRQSNRDEILAIDDASAVNIAIEHIEERDDER